MHHSDSRRSSAKTGAAFGVVGGVFALFFFADVPKVRTDIMQVSYQGLMADVYCIWKTFKPD